MEPSRAPGPQRLATSPRQQHQVTLRYDRGTLLVEPTATRDTGEPTVLSRLARERGLDLRWDARVASHRAPGYRRAALHEAARRLGIALADHCAKPPSIAIRAPELRDYQVAALDAWRARLRGLVVLPTGAGKTLVALGAMAALGRAALVLVPTRVLLAQWQARLREVTGGPVGVMGDGCRALAPVTVSTYASAYAHIDHWGDRFALLVVDEAHHFGGGQHTEALQMCSAPARLGLTATPPVTAEGLALLDDLIGPVVFSQSIGELAGAYLAPFDHIRLHVDLSPAERAEYVAGRARFVETYQRFRHSRGGAGWGAFIAEATQSDAGRRALEGHFQSRRVVATAAAKLDLAALEIFEDLAAGSPQQLQFEASEQLAEFDHVAGDQRGIDGTRQGKPERAYLALLDGGGDGAGAQRAVVALLEMGQHALAKFSQLSMGPLAPE